MSRLTYPLTSPSTLHPDAQAVYYAETGDRGRLYRDPFAAAEVKVGPRLQREAYRPTERFLAAAGALMINTVLSRDRAALARILADAAALAGWQALDTAAITRAWQFFDIARSCGQQAGESAVYAHALGEQSYALADLGRPGHALALLDEAHSLPRLPPLMRTWLTAACAEMYAATGAQREALRGFDQADQLLPADHQDPSMPYLALSPAHLLRWRGHSLAMLGDGDALNYLIKALEDHDRSFVRAECGLRIDLATALKATGELAESRAQALTAKQLAVRIGSERNRKRVQPLTRPL